MTDSIESKLNDCTAVASVIGLGYVGLPLVQHLCRAGYKVIGFDTETTKFKKNSPGLRPTAC